SRTTTTQPTPPHVAPSPRRKVVPMLDRLANWLLRARPHGQSLLGLRNPGNRCRADRCEDVMTQQELAEYFEYLDDLRDSGATNMFGAAPYLAGSFDLRTGEARSILSMWMNTFDPDKTVDERAVAAMLA